MIISKFVTMRVGKKNSTSLKKRYNLSQDLKEGDEISIPIEILSKGSHSNIEIECDYCGKNLIVPYKRYIKNTSVVSKYSCLNKECSNQKIKDVCLTKYGVENPFQFEGVKSKIKSTLNEKYGVDHPMHLDSTKDKIKKTCLKRYGTTNYSKTEEYLKKSKKTNLRKYGVEWTLQSNEIREKGKRTNLEKYGVDVSTKSKDVQEKFKKTCLERYGYVTNLQTEETKIKIKNTCLDKYGTDNYVQSEIFREGTIIGNDSNYIKYIGDKMSLFRCEKGHEFEISSDNFFSRRKINIDLCTVCNPIGDSVSLKEKELYEFIRSIYSNNIIQSYRDELEIDIYLPDLKLGFEFNGLYWHCEDNKNKNYHLNKTKHFKDRGIRIIHIWEDDWTFKKDIIKSQIKNWLKLNSRKIGARNCKVVEINDSKISRSFLDENHIQGYVGSVVKLGLYCNDELIGIMTFDHSEGRGKMSESEWNLSRFCNKLNVNIIGGASKLLRYFIKIYNPSRIISYADKDWSVGDLYENLKFNKVSETDPDYKYVVGCKRVHKSRFRKSNLKTNLTESQHMKEKGYKKIYDCGKIKFEINT